MSPDPNISYLYFQTISNWNREVFQVEKFFAGVKSEQRMKISTSPAAASSLFVSSILKTCHLVNNSHINVNELLRDMRKSGWISIEDLRSGAVLVWMSVDGERHIGFFCDGELAISFHPELHMPYKHHLTFGVEFNSKGKPRPLRKVKHIFWHPRLEK